MKGFFGLSLLLMGLNAWALVDLKNANFSDAWTDISLPGSGYDLKVERAYNSRTLFNGMFGFGWCSEFETNLEVTAEGNLMLTECGAGLETLFMPKSFSKKDVDKSVGQIMAKVRAANKAQPASYFASLEQELRTKDYLRYQYAQKYGLTSAIPEGTKFFANGRDLDVIEKKGEFYVRTLPDNTSQKFRANGKLEKLFDKNGNSIAFTYESDKLKFIVDNNGRKLTFAYYENGKVKSIAGPDNMKSEYKFKDLNNLSYAKTASGNVYTYDYDDLHNMTKVVFPDKTTKEMTYNKDHDWVTSFKDRDGCLETYTYEDSTDDPKNHFWSNVVKKCNGKIVSKSKYEFWYAKRSDGGGLYLARNLTVEGEQTTDVAFNEAGKPMTVSKNKRVTKFEYYANGLLKKKIGPDGTATTMFYENPFKKVSKVDRGGKVTEFGYDAKGNLIKATNSDGQKVTLSYDGRGRIITIEDQAKRHVVIKYEEKFGKPNFIERTGVGAISVSYDNKGEISKVTSAAGTTVAIQVSSTFSNLLELLQPAGVSLSF